MRAKLSESRTLTSLYNESVSGFIGFLKNAGIPRITSMTVKNEINQELTVVINRFVDRAGINRSRQLRVIVLRKCRERLPQLWSRVKIENVHGKDAVVRSLYEGLKHNKSSMEKFEKLRQRKHRKDFLPEDSDLLIMSDALSLMKKDEVMYFVSNDSDFTDFADEIERQFALRVIPVQDLFQLKAKLEIQIQAS